MVTELLGIAGSGILGSAFGMISDWRQEKADLARLKTELKIKREDRLNGRAGEHIEKVIDKPSFSFAFGLLCSTYCLCTLLCFIFPEVTVWTFNPDDEPRKFSVLFGFLEWQHKNNYVYEITTGGLGFSLLHPLSFMIGTVVTGINPRR